MCQFILKHKNAQEGQYSCGRNICNGEEYNRRDQSCTLAEKQQMRPQNQAGTKHDAHSGRMERNSFRHVLHLGEK